MAVDQSESKYFRTAQRMDEALFALLLEKDFEYISIKEICAQAGVSRSAFYLHYENTAELLDEAIKMVNERFVHSLPDNGEMRTFIASAPLEQLYFITDHWLLPYLEFIKENKHIYKAIHTRLDVFDVERAYKQFFETVFSPILSRYGVAEKRHSYMMSFYRNGLVAVVMKWVEHNCEEAAEEIAKIIKLCVEGGRQ